MYRLTCPKCKNNVGIKDKFCPKCGEDLTQMQRQLDELFTQGRKFYNKKDYSNAFACFEKAAKQGHAESQYKLAWMYYEGKGVQTDLYEEFRWFSYAAEQGLAKAQKNVGYCYYSGDGVQKDENKMLYYYRLAADNGDPTAMTNLAWCYANGYAVQKDVAQAVSIYISATKLGDPTGANNFGTMYEDGCGVTKDLSEAVRLYKFAAALNSNFGQYNLARCYEYGIGVDVNLFEALTLYKAAMQNGHSAAKACYENVSKRITRNETEIYSWAKQGADNYRSENYTKAAECFKLGAKQSDAYCQGFLGLCYHLGRGVTKNLDAAFDLYSLAAAKGNAYARYNLGTLYENGSGVSKNLHCAEILYDLAAKGGLEFAEDAWKRVSDALQITDQTQSSATIVFDGDLESLTKQGIEYWVHNDYEKALPLLKKATEAGSARAEGYLGLCYLYGNGVTKDAREARHLVKSAADKNDPNALFIYARNFAATLCETIEYYLKAADLGLSRAQRMIDRIRKAYYSTADEDDLENTYNDGVDYYDKKNYAKAAELFTKCADQGYAPAQGFIGFMYGSGEHFERNYVKAHEYLLLGACGGDAYSQYMCGMNYHTGYGVKTSIDRSLYWLKKSADQNYVEAQYRLGDIYFCGWGVEEDLAESVKWYKLAADQNHDKAQYTLGYCYFHGKGIERNTEKAKYWWLKAAANGNNEAKLDLAENFGIKA